MTELLQRYIKGEVSEEEKRRIMLWLDESPENRREFMALRKLHDISLWQTYSEENHSVHKKRFPLRKLTIEILKIAAILLIGFFGTRLVQTRPDTLHMQTIHVPAGQRAEITLADSTHVWLNACSTLKFPEHFNSDTRQVELDGEGYFCVRHDEDTPFIVHTTKYAVRVLGTEFNVKAYSNTPLFETALIKGSVEIGFPDWKHRLQLKPREIARVVNGKLEKSTIRNYDYFKWKEGLFCFENESIRELIKKLELYYDTRIEIRQPSLLQYSYSGKFRIQDGIEHVLKVLQLKHRFTYTKDDDKNLITIR